MEQFAGEYALEFYKTVEPNVELTVGKAIPIYNSNDLVCGYSIPYFCGDESYGYVNIDYTSENLVTDFTISKGAKSMYESLSENLAETESAITVEDCEEKLYSTDSFEYAVSAGEEDYGDTVNDGENDNGENYVDARHQAVNAWC